MIAKFSRSWQLIKASSGVLKQDKELLVFPLLSGLATIAVSASFLVPLLLTGALDRLGDKEGWNVAQIAAAFLFYLVQYFVIFFFNSALVGAAMIRLAGGDPTVGDGMRIATSKIAAIFGYALIAATVGLLLRLIEERAGMIGRWIAGLLGVAFTVATFMVVPLLVSRDIGPVDAVKESAKLLKQTWGENIVGNAGMGILFALMHFALIGVTVLIAMPLFGNDNVALGVTVVCIALAGFILLSLIQSALQGVYSAALYRYATTGDAGAGFDSTLLESAFRAKR